MGHRSNPIASRLNISKEWDKFLPSKFNFVNDFFFKYFLIEISLNFFLKLQIKKLNVKLTKKKLKRYKKYTEFLFLNKKNLSKPPYKYIYKEFILNKKINKTNIVNNNKFNIRFLNNFKYFNRINSIKNLNIYNLNILQKLKHQSIQLFFNLFYLKLYKNKINVKYKNIVQLLFLFNKKKGRIAKQKEKHLFFIFHDFLLSLQKEVLQFNYCIFEKNMGNIFLKFYFILNYLESEYYNYLRFSQKRIRLKFKYLLLFKQENFQDFFFINGIDIYNHIYKYDITHARNDLFNFSNNYSIKTMFLYLFYNNIGRVFANNFLKNISIIFIFFKKLLLKNLKNFKYMKNFNIDLIFTPFAYSNALIFSKHLKYKLGKHSSIGRVVYSFFKLIAKLLKNIARLNSKLYYCNYLLENKLEKFYLMDNFFDFNGFIEILGFKIIGGGRFTRKSRATSKTFLKGPIPLNKFHKNIDYNFSETISKYGISAIKVWIYRSHFLKNTI